MKTAVSRIGRSQVLPPAFGSRAASFGAMSVRTVQPAWLNAQQAGARVAGWPGHYPMSPVVVLAEPFSALLTWPFRRVVPKRAATVPATGITLDPAGQRPMHRQLYQRLRAAILAGELA